MVTADDARLSKMSAVSSNGTDDERGTRPATGSLQVRQTCTHTCKYNVYIEYKCMEMYTCTMYMYRIAGNFRGVLNFVIFVVHYENFHPRIFQSYARTRMRGRRQASQLKNAFFRWYKRSYGHRAVSAEEQSTN